MNSPHKMFPPVEKEEEWVPLVDVNGNVTGKARRSEVHFSKNEKLLHPVVHLHFFNHQNELFLQKRALWKEIQPGKWDTSVGGHLSYGDTPLSGLLRETKEELGITINNQKLITQYIWETSVEKEFVYMFCVRSPHYPQVQLSEIEEGRFWTFPEIESSLESGIFTPNFMKEFRLLNQMISEKGFKSLFD